MVSLKSVFVLELAEKEAAKWSSNVFVNSWKKSIFMKHVIPNNDFSHMKYLLQH